MGIIKNIIALFLGIFASISALLPTAEKATEYPLTAVVVNVDYENDIVTCRDYADNEWEFFGAEDWIKGDLASMIMNDKGTAAIKDDEIITVRYSGWIEKF